jgi:hypothetical protein
MKSDQAEAAQAATKRSMNTPVRPSQLLPALVHQVAIPLMLNSQNNQNKMDS